MSDDRLLNQEEYKRIHSGTQEEYDALPEEVKEAYKRTNAHHFVRRMGDVGDGGGITLGDGTTFEEWKQFRRKVESQKVPPHSPTQLPPAE